MEKVSDPGFRRRYSGSPLRNHCRSTDVPFVIRLFFSLRDSWSSCVKIPDVHWRLLKIDLDYRSVVADNKPWINCCLAVACMPRWCNRAACIPSPELIYLTPIWKHIVDVIHVGELDIRTRRRSPFGFLWTLSISHNTFHHHDKGP